ncbi:hypothetical protein, partial [Vibrio parahaemolyticus]|uniref:hypothetical protein n=1 Tax=Vibrio parahaemolyticus TaxID=670 RepID=UPI001953053E
PNLRLSSFNRRASCRRLKSGAVGLQRETNQGRKAALVMEEIGFLNPILLGGRGKTDSITSKGTLKNDHS